MKYSFFFLLLFCVYSFSQTKKDTFYVKTKYEHILKDGKLTYTKKAVNQKTFNKNGLIVREVFYTGPNSEIDYELYYHYGNDNENNYYLIEKYKEGNIIGYTQFKYKKDVLNRQSSYSVSNGNSKHEKTIKYSLKKGIFTKKEYSQDKNLIYVESINKNNPLLFVIEEFFHDSDSLNRRITKEVYSDSLEHIEKKIEITFHTSRTDTTIHMYTYNKKEFLDKTVSSCSNKPTITTKFIYYPKGEIKKTYSFESNRNYLEYYEFDLKRYFRQIPYIEPTY